MKIYSLITTGQYNYLKAILEKQQHEILIKLWIKLYIWSIIDPSVSSLFDNWSKVDRTVVEFVPMPW